MHLLLHKYISFLWTTKHSMVFKTDAGFQYKPNTTMTCCVFVRKLPLLFGVTRNSVR